MAIAFSELLQTESMNSSGFFIKKKPPFTALKKSICIPKMLQPTNRLDGFVKGLAFHRRDKLKL